MQRDRHGQQAITDAARQAFAERGYAATSIRDIARAAKLSLSALYHHYGSKQDLLAAIVDEDIAAYFAACDAELARAGDEPPGQLEALVTATVRFRIEHPTESSIVGNEMRGLEPEQFERVQKRSAEGTRRFRDVIQMGVDSGEFRTPYPDDARRAVIAMCNAIGDWYDPDGDISAAELVERYVALAFVIVEYRPRSSRRK